jgi:hypothetical protein
VPGVWIFEAEADFTLPGIKPYYNSVIERIRSKGGLVAFHAGKDVTDCEMAAKMDFITSEGLVGGRGPLKERALAWGITRVQCCTWVADCANGVGQVGDNTA